jgi:iron complex outermembrane receptor protein
MAQEEGQDIREVSLDVLLNTPISTAAKYAQTVSEIAASVTVVTSDDIERYGYRTLGEVFRRVREFYIIV